MTPYILLELYLLISITVIYLGRSSISKKNKWFCALSISVLSLLAVLRGPITPDYNNYQWAFDAIHGRNIFEVFESGFTNFEPGFKLYTKVIAVLTNGNFEMYLLITAFLTYFLWFLALKKTTNNIWLATLLYVNAGLYLLSFNLCRQLLVVSLGMFQIQSIKEKRTKKFLLLAIICALLHRSSLILIVLYCAINMPLFAQKARKLIIGSSIVVLVVFRQSIISFVVDMVYTDYSVDNAYGMDSASINSVLIPMFIAVIVFFLWARKRKSIKAYYYEEYAVDQICVYGTVFYIVFCLLGLYMSNLTRVSYFFFPYAAIAVGNLTKHLKKSNRMIVTLTIVVISTAFYYITTNNSAMNPFVFFWE